MENVALKTEEEKKSRRSMVIGIFVGVTILIIFIIATIVIVMVMKKKNADKDKESLDYVDEEIKRREEDNIKRNRPCSEIQENFDQLPSLPLGSLRCTNSDLPYLNDEEENPNRGYYVEEGPYAGYLLLTSITDPLYACSSICNQGVLLDGKCQDPPNYQGEVSAQTRHDLCMRTVTSSSCKGALPLAKMEYDGSVHNFYAYSIAEDAREVCQGN